MIKNIQFKYIKNDFQTKLKEDILNIQKCEKVLIPADKSRNIYIYIYIYIKWKQQIKEKSIILIEMQKR